MFRQNALPAFVLLATVSGLGALAACSGDDTGEGPGGDGGAVDGSLADGNFLQDGGALDGATSPDGAVVIDVDAGPQPPPGNTCTVTLGAGSGTLTISDKEAKANDVVCVTAGTYTGATLQNLFRVRIIPLGPLVFTGSMHIKSNLGVELDGTVLSGIPYGITFQGFDGGFAFEPGGSNNSNLTLKGIYLNGVGGVDGNNDGTITYDGTPETLMFSRLTMDTIKLTGNGSVFAGTYQGEATRKNVTIGLTLSNVTILNDPASQPVKASGASVFDYLVDHWTVTGASKTSSDVGILEFTGYGTVRNFYRNGGWGYVGRMILASNGAPGEFYAYNIIDVNGQNYGVFDLRGVQAGTPFYSANAHLFNITSGNKITANTYIDPILLMYGLTDNWSGTAYTAEVKNCFVFDNGRDPNTEAGRSTLVTNFSPPPATVVTQSNNIEINGDAGTLAAGYFVDETKFIPAPGSALIGAGTVISQTANDIYGASRGSAYDIGAAQHL